MDGGHVDLLAISLLATTEQTTIHWIRETYGCIWIKYAVDEENFLVFAIVK